jgi:hypothetical protein
MKKLVLTFGLLIFASVAHAETATFCWEAKCESTWAMDSCYNTGVHTPDVHYRFENDTDYHTNCMTGERSDVLSWAQHCARYYSKFYTGDNSTHPLGPCGGR